MLFLLFLLLFWRSLVVVVGHGNVALDCARIVVKGGKGLFDTDIASHVLLLPVLGNGVSTSRWFVVEDISKEPLQLKKYESWSIYTKKGFEVSFVVCQDELDLEAIPESLEELKGAGGRPKQRIDTLLRQVAAKDLDESKSKQMNLRFLTNPHSWELSVENPTCIAALVYERSRLTGDKRP